MSKIYGMPVPALTDTISGLVNGDTLSDLSGTAALSTPATSSSGVAGSPYPIVASAGTLSSTDYTFDFVNGFAVRGAGDIDCRGRPRLQALRCAGPRAELHDQRYADGDSSRAVSGAPAVTTTASAPRESRRGLPRSSSASGRFRPPTTTSVSPAVP